MCLKLILFSSFLKFLTSQHGGSVTDFFKKLKHLNNLDLSNLTNKIVKIQYKSILQYLKLMKTQTQKPKT